jgi:transcriptional regulator with XRE-family HTH domain
MFTNKSKDGRNNLCGEVIECRRKEMGKSQRQLADMLQIAGLDIDKNAIQRIEAGKRFITDIELTYFARVLNLSYEVLLDDAGHLK